MNFAFAIKPSPHIDAASQLSALPSPREPACQVLPSRVAALGQASHQCVRRVNQPPFLGTWETGASRIMIVWWEGTATLVPSIVAGERDTSSGTTGSDAACDAMVQRRRQLLPLTMPSQLDNRPFDRHLTAIPCQLYPKYGQL